MFIIYVFLIITVLKDEPDDLTHLAPTAGDVCIPLEDNHLLSDMLNDFLGENYCPLFTDDLHSLDSECSKNSDPFISYRDDYDDNTTSPHLLSPTLSKVCIQQYILFYRPRRQS